MGRALLRHLKGNVVGYIALFVAMSGTAYAAATIGSPQVIDNSIRSIDLQNGTAVRGIDVIDGSLSGLDVAANTLTDADVSEPTLEVAQTVARARGGPADTPESSGLPVNVPLSNGTFTLPAGAAVSRLFVFMQYDAPSCSGQVLHVEVGLNGRGVGSISTEISSGLANSKVADVFSGFVLFDPTTPSTHTLTAAVSDNCASEAIHVDQIAIDVPMTR